MGLMQVFVDAARNAGQWLRQARTQSRNMAPALCVVRVTGEMPASKHRRANLIQLIRPQLTRSTYMRCDCPVSSAGASHFSVRWKRNRK